MARPGDVAVLLRFWRSRNAEHLEADSLRLDGEPAGTAARYSADGSTLTIDFGDLDAGQTRRITYAMLVRPDAPPGDAENRATARDSLGRETTTGTSIEIERESYDENHPEG